MLNTMQIPVDFYFKMQVWKHFPLAGITVKFKHAPPKES